MNRLIAVFSCCFLVILSSAYAQSVAYGTPGFKILAASVQNAVDSAADGSYIFMSTGTFYETVIVSNKHLTFEGGYDDPPNSYVGGYTAIDAGGAGTALWFIQSRTSFVQNISLVGGVGELVNGWSGGGCLLHQSTVEFTDTSFCSNSAWNGGGLFVGLYSHAKLDGASRVFSNLAYFAGGGIFVDGSCHIVHEDADVFDNTALDSTGGGIQLSSGSMRILQGDVYNNIAVSGAVNGASGGGGIYSEDSALEIGDGSEFVENRADFGGGLLFGSSTVTLGRARNDDVVIAGNSASYSGGGMYALMSDVSCRGVSWQGNTAGADAGGAFAWGSQISGDTNMVSFLGNIAGGGGGGLYLSRSTSTFEVAVFGNDTNSGNQASDFGGGLVLRSSTVSIKGGLFAGNRLSNMTASWGGAIFGEDSTLILTNGPGLFGNYTDVALTSNTALFGGALCISNASLSVYHGHLSDNVAVSNGGAVQTCASTASFYDCLLSANQAGAYGGALYCRQSDQVFVYDSAFTLNSARQGGAIYISDGNQLGIFALREPYYSPPDNWAVLFYGNEAYGAGALAAHNTPTMIQETAFLCNTGHFSIVSIGGTYSISSLGLPHLYMSSSLIAENYESSGKAILDVDLNATGTLFGCTIANNNGSGVSVGNLGSESTLSISNSIIWGNTTAAINNSILTMEYTDVQGTWPGVGNIDTNPLFFSNYHLQYASPCRNAGSPAGPSDFDIDGEKRTGNFDMGCDEFIDNDGDTLPNIIETATGIWVSDIDTGSDPGNAHSDADTMDDGEEWLAGTDPNDSAHYLHIQDIWIPVGQTAPWIRTINGENAYLNLEWTTSCSTGTWTTSLTTMPGSKTNEYGLTPGDIIAVRLRAHR